MAFSEAEANAAVDASIAKGSRIQLHTGAPGSAGTANVAGNDTRKTASFANADGGEAVTDTDTVWSTSEVDTSEDYTHFSRWSTDDEDFLGSGTITASPVTAGNEFKFPAGSLSVSVSHD